MRDARLAQLRVSGLRDVAVKALRRSAGLDLRRRTRPVALEPAITRCVVPAGLSIVCSAGCGHPEASLGRVVQRDRARRVL